VNIFLDANILVSVLNKEYPLFPNTSRIISLGQFSRFSVFTSPLCLAIAFYFAEKKHGRQMAKNKIALMTEHINVSTIDEGMVTKALKNKRMDDFEDGLEYYSAVHANCECIVTEDGDDFFFSTVEVLSSEAFVSKYLIKS
jgi:predicted nucleic acid-binding protein